MDRAILGQNHVVDYDVAMEVACHEALVRQTYKDSVGVLTWCVGMTNATGHTVGRYINKPASLAHCMRLYVWALTSYADQVKDAFRGMKLTKAQFAAAVSFHWNTGAINRASWVKHFKSGNIAAARKAIMNWTTPKEITGRRMAERALFFDGVWSNDGSMPEYTRVRANLSIDWGSRVQTNVEEELRAAFLRVETPEVDQVPQPDARPAAPTLSPSQKPQDARKPVPAPEAAPKAESAPRGKSGRNTVIGGMIAVALAALAGWLGLG